MKQGKLKKIVSRTKQKTKHTTHIQQLSDYSYVNK